MLENITEKEQQEIKLAKEFKDIFLAHAKKAYEFSASTGFTVSEAPESIACSFFYTLLDNGFLITKSNQIESKEITSIKEENERLLALIEDAEGLYKIDTTSVKDLASSEKDIFINNLRASLQMARCREEYQKSIIQRHEARIEELEKPLHPDYFWCDDLDSGGEFAEETLTGCGTSVNEIYHIQATARVCELYGFIADNNDKDVMIFDTKEEAEQALNKLKEGE